VKGVLDIDKTGLSKTEIENKYKQIALDNGIVGINRDASIKNSGMQQVAPAAVITPELSNLSFEGEANMNTGVIKLGVNAELGDGWASHEILHTFKVFDNDYMSGGLLNNPPEPISPAEVDKVIQNSYDKP